MYLGTYINDHFREIWEKTDVKFFDDEQKVSYGQNKTFYFREDLSFAGNESTVVTLPNIPFMVKVFEILNPICPFFTNCWCDHFNHNL